MWVVDNFTPFSAERSWVRDVNGAEVWLVAVKGTFDIDSNGILNVAETQEPVHIAPKFREDSETPSLLHETDLPHKKSKTDVLIEGHAYAPKGQPTTHVNVGLKIQGFKKVLSVHGDRLWIHSANGLSIGKPKPFTKMPIVYERSYGGTDQQSDNKREHDWERSNPVGRGFATKMEHLTGKALPNIEDPKALISSWTDRPKPVGFGPIAGHWSPRVELGGTYDEKWQKSKQPLLPDDFDFNYHQCAPSDQQMPGFLKGGEQVALANLTPNGRLEFSLPRISLSISTQFDDGTVAQHRPVIHTVLIKPDTPQVCIVWHIHHECHHKVLKLMSTRVRLKERIMLSDKDQALQPV